MIILNKKNNAKAILVKEMIDWKEEYISLVRSIGSVIFGKERWFLQDNGLWYDRKDGKEITIDRLHDRIYKEVKEVCDYRYDEEFRWLEDEE